MPKRDISEKCRTSPTLAALSSDAERLWWRLVTYVDDYGRFEAVPKIINGACLPLLSWSDKKVLRCLEEFAVERLPDHKPLVYYYHVKGRLYGQMVSFLTHQRKRDSKPKFPPQKDGTRIMPPILAASCRESPQVAASSVLSDIRDPITDSESVRERRGSVSTGEDGMHGSECPEEVRAKLRRIGVNL
jgi:hypothetical protein